ncbi:glycosyltransferase [Paenibacillus terrigena]|uniref:glycosyltransferase n=1 Tax=Paenibacillus terrigena TaxID=369333 RepID=UPI0028D31750|nr:glycosyltransferase [Paenibacillus terrigena]
MNARSEVDKNIIFVSHDAHFNGAQILSLNIVKVLKEQFDYSVYVISKSGGVLTSEFEKYGELHVLDEKYSGKENDLIKILKNKGCNTAICNTVITGDLVETLKRNQIKVISLIHELPGVIKQYSAEAKALKIAQYADRIVFPSKFVCEKFSDMVKVEPQKIIIQPQGLFHKNGYKNKIEHAKKELRDKLNLASDSRIVLGVGYADKRKGIDLFSQVASQLRSINEKVFFVWVGNRDLDFVNSIDRKYLNEVIFVEPTNHIDVYFAGADVYLMTSREDPFPSVVLDSMNVGVPVVGFKDAGGFSDIVTSKTGVLVNYLNTQEMKEQLETLLEDATTREQMGEDSRRIIESDFNFQGYVFELLHLLGHEYKKVSVIVPNYNYEKYLKQRIDSILMQSYPIYEIIILDDCSTDNSVQIIESYLYDKDINVKIKVQVNGTNSKSVFKQWATGVNLAEGDYIWIAEADDLCDTYFLEAVMKGFQVDDSVILSYAESKQINATGEVIADNYYDYTKDISESKWKSKYLRDGVDEIKDTLAIKNTIPNVSGCVFKKVNIDGILPNLLEYRVAGDWFFYVHLLQNGKIFFDNTSLNYHRRHGNSVTKSENNLLHYNEVVKMQDLIIEQYKINDVTMQNILEYRNALKVYLNV